MKKFICCEPRGAVHGGDDRCTQQAGTLASEVLREAAPLWLDRVQSVDDVPRDNVRGARAGRRTTCGQVDVEESFWANAISSLQWCVTDHEASPALHASPSQSSKLSAMSPAPCPSTAAINSPGIPNPWRLRSKRPTSTQSWPSIVHAAPACFMMLDPACGMSRAARGARRRERARSSCCYAMPVPHQARMVASVDPRAVGPPPRAAKTPKFCPS